MADDGAGEDGAKASWMLRLIALFVRGDEAVLIQPCDFIARVTTQTCRQSGLSVVYTELLDFDGAEIYFTEQTVLHGKTYRDALFSFVNSTVTGIFKADEKMLINPPMHTVIHPGDRLIAISEDDDTLKLSDVAIPAINPNLIHQRDSAVSLPERTLILG